jgi:hypothetical protein
VRASARELRDTAREADNRHRQAPIDVAAVTELAVDVGSPADGSALRGPRARVGIARRNPGGFGGLCGCLAGETDRKEPREESEPQLEGNGPHDHLWRMGPEAYRRSTKRSEGAASNLSEAVFRTSTK